MSKSGLGQELFSALEEIYQSGSEKSQLPDRELQILLLAALLEEEGSLIPGKKDKSKGE